MTFLHAFTSREDVVQGRPNIGSHTSARLFVCSDSRDWLDSTILFPDEAPLDVGVLSAHVFKMAPSDVIS